MGVVIVGGGQGGYQAAASLRTEGYHGSITVIGEEPGLPYQRPPLSKGFLLGKQTEPQIALRPEAFFRDHRIDLLSGERAVAIDTASRRVTLATGANVPYDSLVLAVGARNRVLPNLDGICYLRTMAEAAELKQRLESAESVAIIGGGFIGLEVAAAARSLGKRVTVMEAGPRLMARVVAPEVSEFFRATHAAQGVEIVLNATVSELSGYDLVVAGVGVAPNVELARDAGLAIGNGIVADEFLRASQGIYAIGDCVDYPHSISETRVRLESVQNAVDQAACVAKNIAGKPTPYTAVPWFWTDQFDIRMQMAGLCTGYDQVVLRGDPDTKKFSAFYFREGRLLAIDSINRPADHIAGRKLLAARTALTPVQASDDSIDLRTVS